MRCRMDLIFLLQTWSPNNCISWTSKKKIINCEVGEISSKMSKSTRAQVYLWQTDDSLKLSNDISTRIYQRAIRGYGIQVQAATITPVTPTSISLVFICRGNFKLKTYQIVYDVIKYPIILF